MSTDPVIWVSSILTVIGFSYLFKENEFYKAVEHLYVGVAAGYTVVMGYTNVVNKVWKPLTEKGQFDGPHPRAPRVPPVYALYQQDPWMAPEAACGRHRSHRRSPCA